MNATWDLLSPRSTDYPMLPSNSFAVGSKAQFPSIPLAAHSLEFAGLHSKYEVHRL